MKALACLVVVLTFCVSCATFDSEQDSSDRKSVSSVPKQGKKLWAASYLWAKAPELEPEKWLSEKPDTKGKYILIEHWTTWCPKCRRSFKLLNDLHKKYKDELAVIAISDEDEATISKMEKEFGIKLECYSAIDTKKRQKDKLGVYGVPHTIILDPEGFVVWEGFPYQPGYELTDEKIEKILAIGRKLKDKKNN